MKVRANDIRMRANDIKKARPVDFRSLPVDFMLACLADALLVPLGVTYSKSVSYGKTTRNRSAETDQKVAY